MNSIPSGASQRETGGWQWGWRGGRREDENAEREEKGDERVFAPSLMGSIGD